MIADRLKAAARIAEYCYGIARRNLATKVGTALALLRPKAAPGSISLFFDLNNGCNLNCPMCGSKTKNARSQNVMAYDTFRDRFLPSLRLADNFQFGCLFEPLMIPYFEQAVMDIREAVKPGVLGKSISNGTLLNDSKIAVLIDSNIFRVVSFSFDAVTPELFRTIRGGARLDLVVGNINRLIRYRNDRKSMTRIELNFTIMRRNISELPALVSMAGDMGIDAITTHKLFPDDYGFVDDRYYNDLQDALSLSEEIARTKRIGFSPQTYSKKSTTVENGDRPRGRATTCGFTDGPLDLRMDSFGDVYPTCQRVAGPLGNVARKDLAAILTGPKAQYMLHCFRAAQSSLCVKCYKAA